MCDKVAWHCVHVPRQGYLLAGTFEIPAAGRTWAQSPATKCHACPGHDLRLEWRHGGNSATFYHDLDGDYRGKYGAKICADCGAVHDLTTCTPTKEHIAQRVGADAAQKLSDRALPMGTDCVCIPPIPYKPLVCTLHRTAGASAYLSAGPPRWMLDEPDLEWFQPTSSTIVRFGIIKSFDALKQAHPSITYEAYCNWRASTIGTADRRDATASTADDLFPIPASARDTQDSHHRTTQRHLLNRQTFRLTHILSVIMRVILREMKGHRCAMCHIACAISAAVKCSWHEGSLVTCVPRRPCLFEVLPWLFLWPIACAGARLTFVHHCRTGGRGLWTLRHPSTRHSRSSMSCGS